MAAPAGDIKEELVENFGIELYSFDEFANASFNSWEDVSKFIDTNKGTLATIMREFVDRKIAKQLGQEFKRLEMQEARARQQPTVPVG